MYSFSKNIFLFISLVLFFSSLHFAKESDQKKKKEEPKKASVLPKLNQVALNSKPEKKKEDKKSKIVSSEKKSSKRMKGEIVEKQEELFSFSLAGRKFAQGELLFLKIKPLPKILDKLGNFTISWDGQEIPFTQRQGYILTFLPISPEFSKAYGVLELTEKHLFTKNDSKKYEIPIQKTSFATSKVSHLTMDKQYTTDELSDETKAFIKECSEAKAKAFQSKSDLQVETDFEYPVHNPILNSPFYKRRIYNKEKGRPHGGSDFKGGIGDPIYAINDGTVILARSMYYEGNFTVIDHGLEVYSLYMHQSEILVKPGDKVKKGDLIGKIGSTGMSTGPHLHLGLRVLGTMIDPLSVVQTDLIEARKKTSKK
ncbi:M23 family metallopeptidase [Leptospira licerasiae]|uniref:Peptidase, M23 family n=1 Tax=Leptospira licerasiae str. MMD4847 TaxID=1049971 RepID=A0ABP2RIP3_9LEPT|nr:M23 family metallopeptidase [Leptospira licerasiae]EIE02327.1 peptidase, M23 family [Leptospira licerasiae serovar Varillal str. VAR 010]EJZ43299.1 peptidase, M23 family [Leptospira licerasiae str. MMD4847]